MSEIIANLTIGLFVSAPIICIWLCVTAEKQSKKALEAIEEFNEGIRQVIELQVQILRKDELKRDMEQEMGKHGGLNGEMHRWGDG